jgi:hypothetical protein
LIISVKLPHESTLVIGSTIQLLYPQKLNNNSPLKLPIIQKINITSSEFIASSVKVIISAPSSVSPEDKIMFDLSSSIGSGRRIWKSISFTVSADQFFGHFQIKGSLTNQTAKNTDTDKYLPYRATVLGNLNLNYYISNWNLGIETTGSGTRYSDKANTRKINGYILTNLIADYKFSEQLKFNLRLNNVLDKNYTLTYEGDPNGQINYDDPANPYSTAGFKYKTPGRSVFANLRYDF